VERTSPYLDNADSTPGAASAQDQLIQPGEILTLTTAAAPAVP
jgi:hypothetical protein